MIPWDCGPPGSSVHGISQARILGSQARIMLAYNRIPVRNKPSRICQKVARGNSGAHDGFVGLAGFPFLFCCSPWSCKVQVIQDRGGGSSFVDNRKGKQDFVWLVPILISLLLFPCNDKVHSSYRNILTIETTAGKILCYCESKML